VRSPVAPLAGREQTRRVRRLVVLLLVGACSSDGIDFTGDPGQLVPASFDAWVPAVDVTVDGATGPRFVVDTGAPFTVLDSQAFPGRRIGGGRATVGAFALEFPDLPLLTFDVLPGADTIWGGLVGGDLLRHFAFGIDYRGGHVWLADGGAAAPGGVPATDAAAEVEFDLAGGGLALVPGCDDCGAIRVPATRVLVQATLEDDPDPVWLIVDSGASAVVLDSGRIDALGVGNRPRLDGVTVATAGGLVSAYFTRLWRLAVGDAAEASVPVLVLEDSPLFASITSEVGRPVVGLLGGSFLRADLSVIDYPGRRLRLARYVDQDHIDANEYVRVGFTLAPANGTWEVQQVYPGTDAASQGLAAGDVIASIDGTAVAGLDAAAVAGLFVGFGLGDQVPVGLDRGSAIEDHLVLVEDLLPTYDAP